MWRHSGIGRYLREVVPGMVASWPGARWRLLGPGAGEWLVAGAETIAWTTPIYAVREHTDCAPPAWRDADLRWVPHYNVVAGTRAPLLVTIHDLLPLHERDGWRGALRAAVLRHYLRRVRRVASRVVCPSTFSRASVLAAGVAEAERVVVTPLGVASAFGSATSRAGRESCWLYVGNVKPHKGLDTLLTAFAALAEECPHRLVIVGRREGFFTEAPGLEGKVAALQNRVLWAGEVSEADLALWYARAEALVLPSRHEGFGLPVLEAMAAGCPVVAARAGALPETGGDAARFFETGDAAGLAKVLRELAGDPSERARLSKLGRDRAAGFTWRQTSELTAAALREVWEEGWVSKS
jgi:glycosyltransferase involved in cell wall biosynthesis